MAAVRGRDSGGWSCLKVGSVLCFPLSSYPVNTSWAFLGGVDRRPGFIKVKGSFGEKEFSRRFPGEPFSNPGIQLPCNGIELLLRVQGEVGSLWQVIAEQSIGVFANSPLPGRVGMSEVDGDVCCFCQCFVETHLAALVVGHGKSHLAFKAFGIYSSGFIRQTGIYSSDLFVRKLRKNPKF